MGNCQIIDRLMGTGTIKPKIVYMPFNPLIEPSYNEKPDFFAWWNEHRPAQNTAFSTLLVTRGDHELFRWCVIIALITSGVCDHESRIQKVNLFHRVRLSTIGVFFFLSRPWLRTVFWTSMLVGRCSNTDMTKSGTRRNMASFL